MISPDRLLKYLTQAERGWFGLSKAVSTRLTGTSRYTRLTISHGRALTTLNQHFPGWFWRVQSCSVSTEAWIAPDLNTGLFPDLDPELWHDYANKSEIELRPGGIEKVPLVLCACMVQAAEDLRIYRKQGPEAFREHMENRRRD